MAHSPSCLQSRLYARYRQEAIPSREPAKPRNPGISIGLLEKVVRPVQPTVQAILTERDLGWGKTSN